MDNIFETFDEIFDSIFNGHELTGKLNFALGNLYPSYPPTDIYLKEDKTLVLEFAVAGYPEDSVELNYIGEYLNLKLSNYDSGEKKTYLKQGIKHTNIETKYIIPTDRYDLSKLEAELKNGILKVTIPAREKVESKKIEIKK